MKVTALADLLLELFSEEIPARMQGRAAADLKRLVTDQIVDAGLTYSGGQAFATPRRLTLALSDLPAVTPDTVEERKGPRVDAPEKALEGFLRSTGLSRDDLEVRDDKKGKAWFATIKRTGRPAEEVIAEAVTHAVRNFPWPKSMRWGAGSLRWVRPLHSILCILTDESGARTVPFEVDGIATGNTTRGHRFHAPDPIQVADFDDYVQKLEAAFVILDPEDRARRIAADASNLAFAHGMEVVDDKGLLTEVAGLVEYPVTLMGAIDEGFLTLPPEVLQTSMREHQKFFSVKNPVTGRIERFITVANARTPDNGATVLAGNLKVLTARLADAKFFWENDLRTVHAVGLEGMAEPLKSVTFHNKLGSQWERIERIAERARAIAAKVGADGDQADQAARIAKADLASQMVYEFPELQGTMGRYYAMAANLPDRVADAAEAHYSPLGPSDDVPSEPVAISVALADKLDMLAGFWAVGETPTGSRDPFALRRAALGVIRIILENAIRLRLEHEILAQLDLHLEITSKFDALLAMVEDDEPKRWAAQRHIQDPFAFHDHPIVAEMILEFREQQQIREATLFQDHSDRLTRAVEASEDLLRFLADRLKVYLRDQGVRHDVIQACFDLGGQDDLVLLVNRVRAVQSFLETEDGGNLLTAYRRAANIVAAEEAKDGVEYSGAPDAKYAEQSEETDLFAALDQAERGIATALAAEDFPAAMSEMAALRAPVDAFFDRVTVNAENAILRRNRLCLLTRIKQIMSSLAGWDSIEG